MSSARGGGLKRSPSSLSNILSADFGEKGLLSVAKQKEAKKMEDLKQLLLVPPEERSQFILEQIAEATSDVQFLVKYRNQPEYLEICRYLYIRTLDINQYVFKQGDQGDAFYIILSGGVTIYIDEPTEYKNFMQLKEISRLSRGTAFGEVALITNSKRTATIMVNEPSELIVLEKDVFQAFIKEKKSLHLQKMQAFLENMKLFTLFPESKVLEICTKCQIKKYPSNTIIMRQGDDAAAMYFLRKGVIKAVRQVAFKHDPLTHDKVPFDISDPPDGFEPSQNYTSDKDYYYKCDFLEIDEFRDGDVIGEHSVITSESLEFSAISSSPCEVIYITVFDLNKIIPTDNMDTYKGSLKKYPSEKDIRQIYWENLHWSTYRNQMISNVSIEKNNNRGFMNNLRVSIPRFSTKKIPFNMSDIQIHDNRLYFDLMEQMRSNSSSTSFNNHHKDLTSSYKAAAEQLINDLNSFSGLIQSSKISRRESTNSFNDSSSQSRSNNNNQRKSITQRVIPTNRTGPNSSRLSAFKSLSNGQSLGFLPSIHQPTARTDDNTPRQNNKQKKNGRYNISQIRESENQSRISSSSSVPRD